MNIFAIGWDYDDAYALSAVVIAGSRVEAIDMLELDQGDKVNFVHWIGTANRGETARVVCRESL